ncbi:MAG: hypothetical protein PHY47_14425 [Lachnospiraceae bacterium]|nr:hypothetical protein [Lachnospiraceae bacterium]
MKNKIKKAILICGMGFLGFNFGMPMTQVCAQEIVCETNQIVPRADIIEWRYKIENGRLYRRQYNCTTQKWVGSWELC